MFFAVVKGKTSSVKAPQARKNEYFNCCSGQNCLKIVFFLTRFVTVLPVLFSTHLQTCLQSCIEIFRFSFCEFELINCSVGLLDMFLYGKHQTLDYLARQYE